MNDWLNKANEHAVILMTSFVCVVTLPLILAGTDGPDNGLATDGLYLHLPQINKFLAEPFNWFGYEATAPTLPVYHIIMAGFGNLLGLSVIDNDSLLPRLLHFVVSLVGIVFLLRTLLAERRDVMTLALCLPLITSWYVLSGLLYFGTDGPGFSLLLLLLVALHSEFQTRWSASAYAMALAGMRHLYMPAIAGAYGVRFLFSMTVGNFIRNALIFLPALALMITYFLIWEGATPPGWIRGETPLGFNPHSILGHLGILGMWGVAFGALIYHRFLPLRTNPNAILVAGGLASAVVLAFWLVSDTTFSIEGGRFGNVLWRFAHVIAIGEKSIVVLLAALTGAWVFVLYTFLLLREKRDPAYMGALIVNILFLGLAYVAYQRYSEPLTIACLALSTLSLLDDRKAAWWQFVPMIVLAVVGAATFTVKTYV